MTAWFKRLCDACRPKQQQDGHYMSKAQADELERIMPGEVLMMVVRGREFAIVEREEFEMLLTKAGFRSRGKVPHS